MIGQYFFGRSFHRGDGVPTYLSEIFCPKGFREKYLERGVTFSAKPFVFFVEKKY
jgi:hypothetical protein